MTPRLTRLRELRERAKKAYAKDLDLEIEPSEMLALLDALEWARKGLEFYADRYGIRADDTLADMDRILGGLR